MKANDNLMFYKINGINDFAILSESDAYSFPNATLNSTQNLEHCFVKFNSYLCTN